MDLPTGNPPAAAPGREGGLREHLVRGLRRRAVGEPVADEDRVAPAPLRRAQGLCLVVPEGRAIAVDAPPAGTRVGPEPVRAHLQPRERAGTEVERDDLLEPGAEDRQRDM